VQPYPSGKPVTAASLLPVMTPDQEQRKREPFIKQGMLGLFLNYSYSRFPASSEKVV